MASITWLLSEFRDKDSVIDAIRALRAAGVQPGDLDLFSEEPLELPRGVLDRPSHSSLVAVLGAAAFGIGGTAFVWYAQHTYEVITGGMPVFSFWGTGVITYELTMLGAVLSTFGYFLFESGLVFKHGRLKRDKDAPVPVVPPEKIWVRVRCEGGNTVRPTAALQEAGAVSIEAKTGAGL